MRRRTRTLNVVDPPNSTLRSRVPRRVTNAGEPWPGEGGRQIAGRQAILRLVCHAFQQVAGGDARQVAGVHARCLLPPVARVVSKGGFSRQLESAGIDGTAEPPERGFVSMIRSHSAPSAALRFNLCGRWQDHRNGRVRQPLPTCEIGHRLRTGWTQVRGKRSYQFPPLGSLSDYDQPGVAWHMQDMPDMPA